MTLPQALPITAKNFEAAQRFLDIFQYDITTIQLKYENAGKPWEDVKLPELKKLVPTEKRGIATYAYKGKFTASTLVKDEITLLQNNGFSLWFMVNEGDGVVHDGKFTPRSQESVQYLTACFVDTDKGDLKKLDKFCKKQDCPYNLKVESSPGKYHIYFLLDEKIEATDDNILKWEAIQRTFMQVDPLYDRSLADISQLLRIPYFYHNKRDPHLIKAQHNKDVQRYTLDELYELTDAHKFVKINGQGDRFEYPTETIESGNRHYSMMAYLRHATAHNPDMHRDLLIDAAIGFAIKNFADYKEFMPGNARFSELEHNVDSTINYVEQEKKEQIVANLEEMKEQAKTKKSLFHLDQQFFFDCPNKNIADMVKHISSGALYPCPAYDFAAILAMLGTLKSHLFKSSWNHPPVNYFLCFGPTGIGKNHSQQVISKAMFKLQENSCFAGSLKTEKGLYRGLAENGSRYFVMMDEIELLLSLLTNEKAKVETYTRSLKTALLDLYTHYDRPFKSALTGNEKDKPYVFANPHLNLIGYGTNSALTHGFSLKSISEGLLPRFIILSAPNERTMNDNYDPHVGLTQDHLEYIRTVVMAGKCKKEESYLEIEDLQNELRELNEKKNHKTKEDKSRIAEISTKLAELNSGGRVIGKPDIIPFTDNADKRYVKFIKHIDALIVSKGDDPLANLYTRVAEKAGRLATVIAEKEINTKILDYCLEFVEHQVKAEISACGKEGANLSGNDNYEEKQYQRLVKCIERISTKDNPIVLKRDISRSMNIGSTLLNKVIELGIEREEIGKRKGKDRDKRSEGFYLKFEI